MPEYLSFQLPDPFVNEYADRRPSWGFDVGGGNSLAELTFITKYSRKKEDGTKERWHEACRRVIEGTFSILKDWCKENRTPWNEPKALRSAQDAYDRMWAFKWLPPGRGLWMMGTEFVHAERNSAPLQNCAFVSTEKISTRSVAEAVQPFVRLMEMSMHGVGVGFDSRGAGKLTIHEPTEPPNGLHVIEDSREGWVWSVGVLLESYFFDNRPRIEFDYSLIRPAGEPLKRFGGVAAGPGPLRDLHESIRAIFAGREGEKITSLDIGDIMNLEGKCVVAGSNRRSAEIWLGLEDDKDFLNAKNRELNPIRMGADGWGNLSNNSVIAVTGKNYDHLIDRIVDNGEPGLFYLDLARSHGRLADPANNKDRRVVGVNPCVTGSTWVHTAQGPRQVQDLLGVELDLVVNGKPHPSGGFFETGVKDVFDLKTSEGWTVTLTGDHKVLTPDGWIEANALVKGDKILLHDHDGIQWDGAGTSDEGYVLGLLMGDGTFSDARGAILSTWDADEGSAGVRTEAMRILEAMPHRSDWRGWAHIEDRGEWRMSSKALTELASAYGLKRGNKVITPAIERASSGFQTGFLRGLFDADGCVEGESTAGGISIRLTQADRTTIETVQRMLGRLGVLSRVYEGHKERMADLPDGRGGTSPSLCRPTWRVVISGAWAARFVLWVGFCNRRKLETWDTRVGAMTRGFYSKEFSDCATFVELEPAGRTKVYDVVVDEVHAFDANGLFVHNCGEQSLEHNEMCTLVETFPHHHESYEDFEQTLKWAYLYAKAVTLLPTQWPESNEVMQRNRRIGCSVSGLAQFVEGRGINELRSWLDQGYGFIVHRDSVYSEWLGVRESIKMTSVKPSGTVSLLAGATPGAHWPTGPALLDGAENDYIRRQRFSKADPAVACFADAGYNVEPDVMDPKYTVVVEFPTRGPLVRTETQVSVWEKAMLAAALQRDWADNQVSCTLTFRQDERDQIGPLLRNFQGHLKAISLMPLFEDGSGAFAQMPYEGLAPGERDGLVTSIRPLNWDRLYGEEARDAEGERFCSTDRCELPKAA